MAQPSAVVAELLVSSSLAQTKSLLPQPQSKRIVGLTLGNFDGFHLGHQALCWRLSEELSQICTREKQNEPGFSPYRVLFTFAPHPRRVLGASSREARESDKRLYSIVPLRKKIELVRAQNFDLMFVAHFTRNFAKQSAEEFFQRYILEVFRPRLIAVGDDWSFGRGRSGSVQTLCQLCAAHDIAVVVLPPVTWEAQRVSSSAVREAVLAGELERLRGLLGRRFSVQGKVVHGDKRGRTLGFPTANLFLRAQLLPPDGIYAALVQVNQVKYAAAVSIGVRPTFYSAGERILEAFIIDVPWIDLYGQRIEVEFIKYLREEKKFDSVEELINTMQRDVDAARNICRELSFA